MSEIVIIPEKKGIKKICHRCGHNWIYTGQNLFFCSCPKCKTTITIKNKSRRRNSVD